MHRHLNKTCWLRVNRHLIVWRFLRQLAVVLTKSSEFSLSFDRWKLNADTLLHFWGQTTGYQQNVCIVKDENRSFFSNSYCHFFEMARNVQIHITHRYWTYCEPSCKKIFVNFLSVFLKMRYLSKWISNLVVNCCQNCCGISKFTSLSSVIFRIPGKCTEKRIWSIFILSASVIKENIWFLY